MRFRRTAAFVAALATGAWLVACGDHAGLLLSPLPQAEQVAFGPVASPTGAGVEPLQRDQALDGESWSFVAGPNGAESRNKSSGLTIIVPPGALTDTVRITVTVLAGASVAYRFEPHGLQFAAPVTLIQSLHGTKVKRDAFGIPRLIGGYFEGDTPPLDPATGAARVIELLPVWLDSKGQGARLTIRHFSGYTVASAMVDPPSEESR